LSPGLEPSEPDDGLRNVRPKSAGPSEGNGDVGRSQGDLSTENCDVEGESDKAVATTEKKTYYDGADGGSLLVKMVDEEDESEDLLPKANGRPIGTQDILNEVAREKRERKATKSDDAEIPEYLWEEHLLQVFSEFYSLQGIEKIGWSRPDTLLLGAWNYTVGGVVSGGDGIDIIPISSRLCPHSRRRNDSGRPEGREK
jgi:hypothetical protein